MQKLNFFQEFWELFLNITLILYQNYFEQLTVIQGWIYIDILEIHDQPLDHSFYIQLGA